ncbi:hypothetical protein ACFV0T_26440 [Streptomyces sp. NPDC059582]|uniref:hypothetical protein n=1 Tax=Streptomyces sp. NPDC059582 TaxID=3346875 RepID=UPI0036C050E0
MTTSEGTVALEKMAAEKEWDFFLQFHQFDARLGEWEQFSTEAGPLVSVRVEGPDAPDAIQGGVAISGAWLDYSDPARLACAWQSNGVWVELWCPVDADRPPTAVLAPSTPPPAAKRSRLALRLPFTRRNKTPKESQSA